jgi:hypothetical protein
MGGFGSGRKWGKDCADDMRRLDVRRLVRDGYLKAGMVYGWQWTRRGEVVASINVKVETERIWLNYRQRQHGGEWQDMRYPVQLDRTACHLGGERVWWRCPAGGCGRRVAVLFGGKVFACRHCHRLAYTCQRETEDDRAARRADTLREQLGWVPGILNGEGGKPKGMHWRTFERLRAEHGAHVNRALVGMAQRLKLCESRLSDLL